MTKPQVSLQIQRRFASRVKRKSPCPNIAMVATIGGIKVRATVGHAHLMLLVNLPYLWLESAWQ